MDLISSKIKFTNIQLACGDDTLEDFQFSTGYSVVLDLDADIRIEINDICIFDCPMTPILELYLQLKKWIEMPYIDNFSYLSLENSNPIFRLEKNNDKWCFMSDFTREEINLEIDIYSFKKAAHVFLEDFQKHFRKIFNVDISLLLHSIK